MQCSCVEPKLQHCLSTQLAWQIRFAAHLPCVLPSGLHLCLSSSVHAHTKIINIFVHFGVNKTISAHQSNNRQYLDTVNFRHLITLKKNQKWNLFIGVWSFATIPNKTVL